VSVIEIPITGATIDSLRAELSAKREALADCRAELAEARHQQDTARKLDDVTERTIAFVTQASAAVASERDSLRSQLLARDLECVRLRAGLIRALAEIDALDNMSERDFGSWMPGLEIAELRKLVQP